MKQQQTEKVKLVQMDGLTSLVCGEQELPIQSKETPTTLRLREILNSVEITDGDSRPNVKLFRAMTLLEAGNEQITPGIMRFNPGVRRDGFC